MYIGDPHRVAAIISPGRNLANPKSAGKINNPAVNRELQNRTATWLLLSKLRDFSFNQSIIYSPQFLGDWWREVSAGPVKRFWEGPPPSLPILILISEGRGFAFPEWLSSRFCGFRSRWTMPFDCSVHMAEAMDMYSTKCQYIAHLFSIAMSCPEGKKNLVVDLGHEQGETGIHNAH